MCFIVENQTKEWKYIHNQLAIAQAQFDRYLEFYPDPDFDISLHIHWDLLDKQARQANDIEIELFFKDDYKSPEESGEGSI
jgi:hypothetical protein